MKGGVQEDLTSMLIGEQYETINSSVSYLPFRSNVFLSVPMYLKAPLPYAGVLCSSQLNDKSPIQNSCCMLWPEVHSSGLI